MDKKNKIGSRKIAGLLTGVGVLIALLLLFWFNNDEALMAKKNSWNDFKEKFLYIKPLNFALDTSKMDIPGEFYAKMKVPMEKAFLEMDELEKGSIANPDEGRRVGHYWLRNPDLAPDSETASSIRLSVEKIKTFAQKVHEGVIRGEGGEFKNLLCIGIGGSSLGPKFVSDALRGNGLKAYFLDNTDPDGIDLVLNKLQSELGQTLVVTISKSGSTPEPRNGMLETRAFYKKHGLNFNKHAVAITGENSQLFNIAKKEGWLDTFLMWDWVGGRTSELSAVGLLPAALEGIDIDQMLAGARAMDAYTRMPSIEKNPASQLALAWFYATEGKGKKDMVVLPYKDRLILFSRYLQQLVMESLGKEKDLSGNIVNQGIAVYGNKGSTDQHAYVQQLRNGLNNFFVTFIEVLKDREGAPFEVEEAVTTGDYLQGFLLGTREALYENGRKSVTITVPDVSPFSVGMLIALFERTVGFYASLINVNAYHQPGVEAGKKAAASLLKLKKAVVAFLKSNKGQKFDVEAIANGIGSDKKEAIFKILQRLSINGHQVSQDLTENLFQARYSAK